MEDITAKTEYETAIERERILNHSIIDTVREPLLVLDGALKVLNASPNFYATFKVEGEATVGKQLFDLGNGQWDIPELRQLLTDTLEKQEAVEAFEIDHEFPDIGQKVMLLNARKVYSTDNNSATILLAFEDITERKQVEEFLRLEQSRLNSVLENMQSGVFLFDENGENCWMNPEALRIHGFSSAADMLERFSQYALEWELSDPSGRVLPLEEWPGPRAFRGDHFQNYEVQLRNLKSGRTRNVLYSSSEMRDIDGNIERFVFTILDITDRKLADNALRESEELLRLSSELANVAAWEMDLVADSMTRSSNHDKLYGLTGVGQWHVNTFMDATHVDDREKCNSIINESLAPGGPDQYKFDFRILYPDQSVHWLNVIGVVIARDSKGVGIRLRGFITDITDRKQAEESLRESEERFSSAFHTSPAAISITRIADGKFIDVNQAFLDLFEFSRDEVIGHTSTELGFLTGDERRQIIEAQLKSGGLRNAELLSRSSSGRPIYLLFSSKPMQLAGEPHHVTTLVDVTERKQAERDLKKSQQLLAETEQIGKVGGWEFNIDTGKQTWTEEVYLIHELDLDSDPSVETGINFYTPESRPIIDQAVKRAIEYGEPYDLELDIITAKGNLRHVHTIGKADLESRRIYGFFQDITARVQAEAEKRTLKERLQRSEKMESLGTLAGGVAHDLNNVLGVIVGYSELLMHSVDPESLLHNHAKQILQGGIKAAAIVDDLLTLARRGVQGSSIVNLNRIVSDAHASPEYTHLLSHHSSVRITIDLGEDVLNISGSPVHLTKSIYNLVSNACEAMPMGGVVTIKTVNRYLDRPVNGHDNIQKGEYVVLSVSDTGEGISEADQKRIFEPFFTKKRMGRSGTGLGLAVVWGTVQDHGGYIDVQSEQGKGTTFELYFPANREELAVEADTVSTANYAGKGESILAVDDVLGQRELAASILRTLNYQVTTAASGEEAVAYLQEHDVDLIVLDMIMDSGMDGLETYKQVLNIRPNQKAIIVSGFSESDRVKEARKLGAGAYLRKPYIKETLGLAVRKELDRK